MDNNPLKQFFRRPSVYLKLPSNGKFYDSNVISPTENGELPVYPMTAIDEITVRTPDALFNGTAVSELIKSCIPNIKDPWAISNIDLDAILIAIKAASSGENYEIDSGCPGCNEVSTYSINLIAILSSLKPGNYDELLEIGDLKFKFRPLTYKQMNEAANAQFEVQKTFSNIINIDDDMEKERISHDALRKITMLTMELVAKTIEYIETPNIKINEYDFIRDFLENCDRNVYNAIRDHNTELRKQTEIKPLDITCGNCSNQYKQDFTLNPADFFA